MNAEMLEKPEICATQKELLMFLTTAAASCQFVAAAAACLVLFSLYIEWKTCFETFKLILFSPASTKCPFHC